MVQTLECGYVKGSYIISCSNKPLFDNKLWILTGTKPLIYLIRITKLDPFLSIVIMRWQKWIFLRFTSCCLQMFTYRWVWSLITSRGTTWRCLLTRPGLWRCWLMMLCEGPTFVNNVRALVFGCCLTLFKQGLIFYKWTSPWPWFVFKVHVTPPPLQSSELVLYYTFIESSWLFHFINFFCHFHSALLSRSSIKWL